MSEKNKTGKRARNFATVVYLDSAPDNWMSILEDQRIPAFISPYHDKDKNPTGEPKKPHYHVVVMFDGCKTLEQVREVFDLIGGVGCEVIQNVRGYARYLCHLDNPDKAQYEPENVRALAGADYLAVIGTALDKYKAIGEMIDYCEMTGERSFASLMLYARKERFDWFRILCDCATLPIKEYLKSRTWTDNRGLRVSVDEDGCVKD